MPSHPAPTGLARVAHLAVLQHGLFTRHQAHAAGLTRGMVDRRLRSGELVAVDHAVYRSALTPPSWHQRLLAACLAGPAVASHRSAAALWNLPDWDRVPLEVTALRHRRRKADDVVWHESLLLRDDQITELEGVPTTRPTRTFIDLAVVVDHMPTLLRALDDLLRRRLTSVPTVQGEVERMGAIRPGSARVLEVLRLRAPTASRAAAPESDLETRFEVLLREARLPVPDRQVVVRTDTGRTLRIDFAYPSMRVGIELLGGRYHAMPDRWEADLERLVLLAAMDWQMLCFTDQQVRRTPARVVQAVEAALGRARSKGE